MQENADQNNSEYGHLLRSVAHTEESRTSILLSALAECESIFLDV